MNTELVSQLSSDDEIATGKVVDLYAALNEALESVLSRRGYSSIESMMADTYFTNNIPEALASELELFGYKMISPPEEE